MSGAGTRPGVGDDSNMAHVARSITSFAEQSSGGAS
jgi:hypothetical protein